ncbi:MAG: hypothetical protein HZB13_01045 [Acidobacteria bacterium]|nr:hypothetical protein [Acidobacteriota bacterium]
MMSVESPLLHTAALLLFCSTVHAGVGANEPGDTKEPVQQGDVREQRMGNPDGDPTKPPLDLAAQRTYQPLTGKERWALYLRGTFWNPGVLFRVGGPALGAQMNNEPPQWGQGMEGYSKHFANRFGRFALRETYEAAGAALLQHEVRYIRSKRSGFLPRAADALAANFVTYDRSGRRTPHMARVGSVIAAEFTGNLWMPNGYRDPSSAMRGAGMQLGVGSAFNLMREFAPELKKIFTRR